VDVSRPTVQRALAKKGVYANGCFCNNKIGAPLALTAYKTSPTVALVVALKFDASPIFPEEFKFGYVPIVFCRQIRTTEAEYSDAYYQAG